MKRTLTFTLLLLFGFGITDMAAQGQQGDENSMLPEIDPQDIEIRSQFKARFPGLRRQPILGFDPSPRVYQIDPNRMPFMETPEQVVASLPVSELSRPDPPAYTPFYYSSDINVFGRAGIGNYVSPEVKFWGVSRISSKSYVGGDLDFSSSNGHLDNQESGFRFFDANAEYASKINDEIKLGFNGGISSSFNNLFDLDQATNIPDDAQKEYSGFNLGADLEQFQNSISGWKTEAGIRYFDAHLTNGGSQSGTSEERVYNASVAKRWAGSHVNETFTVKAGAIGGNFNSESNSASWVTVQGGVVYDRLFNYSTKVEAEASVYYGSSGIDSKVYLGPSVTVKHPLIDILTLTVKGGAEPYMQTVEQLHTKNRFLNVDNALRHSYRIYGSAEARLDYTNNGSFSFGTKYENISNQPIFVREPLSSVGGGSNYLFYQTDYADTYTLQAYASAVHRIIPEKFSVHGKIYLQSPKLQGGNTIPYKERIGVNGGVNIRFLQRFNLEAWIDYVGSRETFQTDEKLGGFMLLGSQLDVEIAGRFGAYVKLVNMLNQDYEVWQGYSERPFQLYGGLTVTL